MFENYFNENFDLQEAVEFKDAERRKEFNRPWLNQFKDILLNTFLQHCGKTTSVGGGWTHSLQTYKIENVFVGVKTGNLIIQTTNRANVGKQFSIDALRNSFSSNGTRKEHWELDTIELTEKLLALLNEYNAQYDLAAKDSNSVYRIQLHAESSVEEKIRYGKELAAAIKGTDAEQWVKENITNILFKVPTTKLIENPPKSLIKKLDRIIDVLEDNFRGITSSRHFERFDKPAERVKAYYSIWGISAITTFSQPYSAFPEELKELVRDAKARSKEDAAAHGKQVDNTADEPKSNDKTIGTCYFAFAMLDLLDDDYTFLDKAREDTRTPEEIADGEDTFKQNFDSINAYGEKVESLKEAKEGICCICGEPIEGYGNNPEPYKHEGRCCDACNLKFVIPARLAELNKPKE